MLSIISFHNDGPDRKWTWRIGEEFSFDGVFSNSANVRVIAEGPELDVIRSRFTGIRCIPGNNVVWSGEDARFIGTNLKFVAWDLKDSRAQAPRPTVEDPAAEGRADLEALRAVRTAVHHYYGALDRRDHGGNAESKAFRQIEEALGLSWDRNEYRGFDFEVFAVRQLSQEALSVIRGIGITKIAEFMALGQDMTKAHGLAVYESVLEAQRTYNRCIKPKDMA